MVPVEPNTCRRYQIDDVRYSNRFLKSRKNKKGTVFRFPLMRCKKNQSLAEGHCIDALFLDDFVKRWDPFVED